MKLIRLFAMVMLVLSLLLVVSFGVVTAAQPAWQGAAEEALAGAMSEIGLDKGDGNLLVLTNAGYGQIGEATTEAFIDLANVHSGCSIGQRSLLTVHKSIMDPLWFSIFRKDTGKMVYAVWKDGKFEQQIIDADPGVVLTPEGWKKAAAGLIGPNMFSVVSISLTWTANPPWPLLLAATYHDHFCPGVNSGYIYGEYFKEKYPLSPGESYAFATAPAKCAADALQVMFNTTSGKSSGFSMSIDSKTAKGYARDGITPATVAMRINQKADKCEGLVLGISWDKAYEVAGLKAGDLSPKGGRTNPMFWIARVKMSAGLAGMPMEELKKMIIEFKSFSGKANLAGEISGGDPYAVVMK